MSNELKRLLRRNRIEHGIFYAIVAIMFIGMVVVLILAY